jgi:hypothetical protein
MFGGFGSAGEPPVAVAGSQLDAGHPGIKYIQLSTSFGPLGHSGSMKIMHAADRQNGPARTRAAKFCRGALGFRGRRTRKQKYSVEKERAAGSPSQVRPRSKYKTNPMETSRRPGDSQGSKSIFEGKIRWTS